MRSKWNQISANISNRCNYKKGWYGRHGIKKQITISEIKELWYRDKADLLKHPSIDRINPKANYTKDNCRFIELEDNIKPTQFKHKTTWGKHGETSCKKCHRTSVGHHAKGLCHNCYNTKANKACAFGSRQRVGTLTH